MPEFKQQEDKKEKHSYEKKEREQHVSYQH